MTILKVKSLIRNLIATPSVSSTQSELDQSNLPIINLLATWLEDIGFSIEIMEVPHYPGKFNLIGTLGRGEGGLVLSGHTDTVPYDQNRWQSDPFSLKEQDNRWYGLGTCDMKGFFALAIEAVRSVPINSLKKPIMIVATADEESSMSGARAIAQSGKDFGRYAIIGEPTNLQPIHAHKGIMMERIRIRGKSGHSSNPYLGANAIEGMHKAIQTIMDYRQELGIRYNNPLFSVPTPTMNLGCIHGGDNPNRICGSCTMEFDVRLLPGICSESVRHELRQRLDQTMQDSSMQLELEPIFASAEAFSIEKTAELVKVCEELTGQEPGSVAFATEAPIFAELAEQTLVMGPGSIDQAHQPNEFLSLSQINPTIALLESLIKRFCC